MITFFKHSVNECIKFAFLFVLLTAPNHQLIGMSFPGFARLDMTWESAFVCGKSINLRSLQGHPKSCLFETTEQYFFFSFEIDRARY